MSEFAFGLSNDISGRGTHVILRKKIPAIPFIIHALNNIDYKTAALCFIRKPSLVVSNQTYLFHTDSDIPYRSRQLRKFLEDIGGQYYDYEYEIASHASSVLSLPVITNIDDYIIRSKSVLSELRNQEIQKINEYPNNRIPTYSLEILKSDIKDLITTIDLGIQVINTINICDVPKQSLFPIVPNSEVNGTTEFNFVIRVIGEVPNRCVELVIKHDTQEVKLVDYLRSKILKIKGFRSLNSANSKLKYIQFETSYDASFGLISNICEALFLIGGIRIDSTNEINGIPNPPYISNSIRRISSVSPINQRSPYTPYYNGRTYDDGYEHYGTTAAWSKLERQVKEARQSLDFK